MALGLWCSNARAWTGALGLSLALWGPSVADDDAGLPELVLAPVAQSAAVKASPLSGVAPSGPALVGDPAPAAVVVAARGFALSLPGGARAAFTDLMAEPLGAPLDGVVLTTPVGEGTERRSATVVLDAGTVSGTLLWNGVPYALLALDDGRTAVVNTSSLRIETPPHPPGGHAVPVPENGAVPSVPQRSAPAPTPEPPLEPLPRGVPGAPVGAEDAGATIDLLMLWSAATERTVGGATALRRRIETLRAQVNAIYAASGVTQRLRVVRSRRTAYVPRAERSWEGRAEDLRRLREHSDGAMDDVHAERDRVGADAVVLLFYTPQPGGNRWLCGGGQAYLLDGFGDDADWAFAVVGLGGVSDARCVHFESGTLAHEVGHLGSADHNPEEPGTDAPFPYGHGYCNAREGWRTVMAYDTGGRCPERVRLFSTPHRRYRGTPVGNVHTHHVARLLNETGPSLSAFRRAPDAAVWRRHDLPYVLAAARSGAESFLRIHNHESRAARVRIWGWDDAGTRYGPAALDIAPGVTVHLTSTHLEGGHATRGLHPGLGDGRGHWRLAVESPERLTVRAYLRIRGQGFTTALFRTAEPREGSRNVYAFPFMNPGSNRTNVGILRVANPNDTSAAVEVIGWDDSGARGGPVRLQLGAQAARSIDVADLERGASGLTGRLGDGKGKWRLEVRRLDGKPLAVLSLLHSVGQGLLSNVSP